MQLSYGCPYIKLLNMLYTSVLPILIDDTIMR